MHELQFFIAEKLLPSNCQLKLHASDDKTAIEVQKPTKNCNFILQLEKMTRFSATYETFFSLFISSSAIQMQLQYFSAIGNLQILCKYPLSNILGTALEKGFIMCRFWNILTLHKQNFSAVQRRFFFLQIFFLPRCAQFKIQIFSHTKQISSANSLQHLNFLLILSFLHVLFLCFCWHFKIASYIFSWLIKRVSPFSKLIPAFSSTSSHEEEEKSCY